jgi:lipopolysaccharide export system permease protein
MRIFSQPIGRRTIKNFSQGRPVSLRSTLFKYISREIWSVFFVSLMVFIFIALGSSIMGIMDLLVNLGISFPQLIRIILYMLPQVILFSLPVACLMSVMLAFIRFSSDNEIIAMNASGISLYQMLPPVMFFSLIGCLLAAFLTVWGVPWGNRTYKDYTQGIIQSKTNLTIQERVFYEAFDRIVFYVNSFSEQEMEMKDIFVVDRSNDKITNTIVAERGMILNGSIANTINVHFINGTVFSSEKNIDTPRILKFDTDDMAVYLGDVATKIALRQKQPKEMYIDELIGKLNAKGADKSLKNEIRIRLYEMFSIPLAIFILGIIGSYLGSHVKARGRSVGVMISLFVFLLYYTSLMGSKYLCEMGIIAPFTGVSAPLFLLLAISLFMFSRVKKIGTFSLFH